MKSEIFETTRNGNYTGNFRILIGGGYHAVAFRLPGRGGLVTKKAAEEIEKLWAQKLPALEISRKTGCEIVW